MKQAVAGGPKGGGARGGVMRRWAGGGRGGQADRGGDAMRGEGNENGNGKF